MPTGTPVTIHVPSDELRVLLCGRVSHYTDAITSDRFLVHCGVLKDDHFNRVGRILDHPWESWI